MRFLHFTQTQEDDPFSTLNLFKKLLKLRTESPALQTNTIEYAVVTEEIFSFLRIPDKEDAGNSTVLVAINFSNQTIIADYTIQLKKNGIVFKGYGGIIALSSNMNQDGKDLDLTAIVLEPNEALVIKAFVDVTKSSSLREIYFLFTSASLPVIFYFILLWRNKRY